MTNIKVAVFDADGVVVPAWHAGRFEREHGITPEMMRGFCESALPPCLIGQADARDLLPPYLEQWGWQGTPDEFMLAWFEAENVIDGQVIGAVRMLQKRKVACCLASNQEAHRAAYMKERMGFFHIFDHLFFSSELGCAKPDPAFYEQVTRVLRVEAQEICLWDNLQENVEGARACGWQAEVYTGFEGFEAGLRKKLGKVW